MAASRNQHDSAKGTSPEETRKQHLEDANENRSHTKKHPIKDRLIEESQGKRAGTRALPDRESDDQLH